MATRKKPGAEKKGATPIEFGWTPINEFDPAGNKDGSLTTKSPELLLSSESAGVVMGYIEQYKMNVNHHSIPHRYKKGDIVISTSANVKLTDVTAFSAKPAPFKVETKPAGATNNN